MPLDDYIIKHLRDSIDELKGWERERCTHTYHSFVWEPRDTMPTLPRWYHYLTPPAQWAYRTLTRTVVPATCHGLPVRRFKLLTTQTYPSGQTKVIEWGFEFYVCEHCWNGRISVPRHYGGGD